MDCLCSVISEAADSRWRPEWGCWLQHLYIFTLPGLPYSVRAGSPGECHKKRDPDLSQDHMTHIILLLGPVGQNSHRWSRFKGTENRGGESSRTACVTGGIALSFLKNTFCSEICPVDLQSKEEISLYLQEGLTCGTPGLEDHVWISCCIRTRIVPD